MKNRTAPPAPAWGRQTNTQLGSFTTPASSSDLLGGERLFRWLTLCVQIELIEFRHVYPCGSILRFIRFSAVGFGKSYVAYFSHVFFSGEHAPALYGKWITPVLFAAPHTTLGIWSYAIGCGMVSLAVCQREDVACARGHSVFLYSHEQSCDTLLWTVVMGVRH